MNMNSTAKAAKAVVRRNTDEVQSRGDFGLFEEIFADDFVDHATQPATTPDKAGVRKLYTYLREAFPDFHADIHWQLVEGDRVTTYKTYHGTHEGTFLGVGPTHRKVRFETVAVMRVQNGQITDHWGVANLLVFDARDRRLDTSAFCCDYKLDRAGDHGERIMRTPR